jgi:hypothetical protein
MSQAIQEKRERIRKLEQAYLSEIESLRASYRAEIKRIASNVEGRKVDYLKKKLGI